MKNLCGSLIIGMMAALGWAGDRPGKEYYCLDQDSLALLGYSPVSYFEKNRAELGKKEFAVTHEGITYHFTDANQVKLFKANPTRYEPAHGGWCSVMMGGSGNRAMANPEAFKIVDGRLMVFYRGKTQQGALVDGLAIWNSRNEAAVLKKADKAWQKILAGNKKSQIIDVGDSAVPEALRKPKAELGSFKAVVPGDALIDGNRIQPFAATYSSPTSTMKLTVDSSTDIDGSATLNFGVALHYPMAVVMENYVLSKESMALRYAFRPLVMGPDSHYFVGFFEGGKARGSRTYFAPKAPAEIKADLESPVIEPQLSGYVLAGMDLKPGMKGKIPCYAAGTMERYWRTFEVKPKERVTLANGKRFQAWPVVLDGGTNSATTVWLTREAPYVVKRVRLVSGSPVVQELVELN